VTFVNVMETKWFTWAPDIITITRDTTVTHKLIKGVYVDYGKIPDVTMKLAVVALVG
jgi:5-enolpyruvylshikimate-3-phosphate synthase